MWKIKVFTKYKKGKERRKNEKRELGPLSKIRCGHYWWCGSVVVKKEGEKSTTSSAVVCTEK